MLEDIPKPVLIPVRRLMGGTVIEPPVAMRFDFEFAALKALPAKIKHDDKVQFYPYIDDAFYFGEIRGTTSYAQANP